MASYLWESIVTSNIFTMYSTDSTFLNKILWILHINMLFGVLLLQVTFIRLVSTENILLYIDGIQLFLLNSCPRILLYFDFAWYDVMHLLQFCYLRVFCKLAELLAHYILHENEKSKSYLGLDHFFHQFVFQIPIALIHLQPLLIAWFNFNPSMLK